PRRPSGPARGRWTGTGVSGQACRRFLSLSAPATRRATSRSTAMASSSRNPSIASSQTELTFSAGSTLLIEVSSSAPSAAPYTGPAAAGEGPAADPHRAHPGQLVAGAGRRVDVAEPRHVQRPGQAGQRAAHDVRGDDPAAQPDAGQPRRLGVRADRVDLAARA